MCGIVGYIGNNNATPIVLTGLKKLEYRGYDSAGIAVLTDKNIEVRRDAGKLANLEILVSNLPIVGKVGIGHTRWATHGEPSTRNAHPHLGSTGKVVVVHNGIVENFIELKEELTNAGVQFQSDTDTETIVHLIEKYMESGMDLEAAVRKTLSRLKGAHGVVVMSILEPDRIIAARIGNAGGVVIGLGQNENFIASDIPAILDHTRQLIFLESRQMAVVKKTSVSVSTVEGEKITPQISSVAWDAVSAEKGEYRHFMQKEIHEQVRSITDTLAGRVDFEEGKIRLPELNLTKEKARKINKNNHHCMRHSFTCRNGWTDTARENCPHSHG
jgi:glucosamine--fructose-6-phosphate aminotransferase (isomerizing)